MKVCNRAGITEELAQEGCIDKDTISLNMVGDVEVDITSTGLCYFEDEKITNLYRSQSQRAIITVIFKKLVVWIIRSS